MTSHDTQTTAPSARELGEQQALRWLTTYYKAAQRLTWFRDLYDRFFWDLSYPEWFRRTISGTVVVTYTVCGISWGLITLLLLFRYIIPLFWWLCSRPAAMIAEIVSDGGTPHFSINFVEFLFATLMLAVVVAILAHFLDPKARRNLRVLVETTSFIFNCNWTHSKWAELQAANPTQTVLKYCSNCSLGLPARANYCYECGHNQSNPAPAQRSYFTDVR